MMPDPSRFLNLHIPGWRRLSANEKKAIRDFAVLWSFFELHATGHFGDPDANPRNICLAVERLEIDPDLNPISNEKEYFRERYLTGRNSPEYWGGLRINEESRIGREVAAKIRHGLGDVNAGNLACLTALLLVLNRLRNNFLHGEKAKYDFEGQFDNFSNANRVLMYSLKLWPRGNP